MPPNEWSNKGLNGARANRLSSWKEIADYLGCDKRTCLRWEKSFGLPIHRLEGSKKSRVFAFRDEIERWQREKSSLINGQAAANGPGANPTGAHRTGQGRVSRPGSKRKAAAIWAAGLTICAAAVFAALSLSGSRTPVDFRIDRGDLVILNGRGKELWRHATGVKNLASEERYRARFQRKGLTEEGASTLPYLMLEDIDNDGKTEVLFAVLAEDGSGSGSVFCFSQKGKKLWEFGMGRPLEFGKTRYSGDFSVRGFDVFDLEADGKKEVVALAHQMHRFPTRLAVLDADGRLLGDFWNSGQLASLLFLDLNEDGRKEILAAGTNNEYGQGIIIVFDSANIRGCSPQFEEKYAWKGMEPGSQLFYIRIPRSDAELADYFPLDSVSHIINYGNGQFSAWSDRSGLEYVFDRFLNVVEVRGSHHFQVLHENSRKAGKISSVADAAYFERIRRSVLYWNGSSWSWRSWSALAVPSR